MKRLILVMQVCLPFISGCAVGSATAGYSLRAKTADELKPEARQSIIDQVKKEIIEYLEAKGILK